MAWSRRRQPAGISKRPDTHLPLAPHRQLALVHVHDALADEQTEPAAAAGCSTRNEQNEWNEPLLWHVLWHGAAEGRVRRRTLQLLGVELHNFLEKLLLVLRLDARARVHHAACSFGPRGHER